MSYSTSEVVRDGLGVGLTIGRWIISYLKERDYSARKD